MNFMDLPPLASNPFGPERYCSAPSRRLLRGFSGPARGLLRGGAVAARAFDPLEAPGGLGRPARE
jgi:hypothetical protein